MRGAWRRKAVLACGDRHFAARMLRRRSLLRSALALPLAPAIAGCASPLPKTLIAKSQPAALQRLRESAEAHGQSALAALRDINVSYSGSWRALVGRLQPALVDADFRGDSQERYLVREQLLAQAHSGPGGRKQVLRGPRGDHDQGEVQVWVNGAETLDGERRAAAALVADGYLLFLLGPAWLARRSLIAEFGGVETIEGRECDVIEVQLRPGLGFTALDQLGVCVDRADALMRRVRFSMNGLGSTRGTVAEVDCFDHLKRHGIAWPTRFSERLRMPIPGLPVHDWLLTGLDVNRGYDVLALANPQLQGAAAAPAAPLAQQSD